MQSINLETISICNLDCKFCSYGTREDRGIMSMDNFITIVDKIKSYGINTIRLTPMTGELFLDPYLFDRLDYLEQQQIHFAFFTNLIEYTDKIWQYEYLTKMHISVNCHDLNSFIELTNGSIYQYNKFYYNILDVQKSKEANRVQFVIKSIDKEYSSSNMLFTDLWREIFRCRADISFMTKIDNWAGKIKEFPEYKTLKLDTQIRKTFCNVLKEKNIILWDGSFCACGCRDIDRETYIANLLMCSLEDIYNSNKYTKMMEKIPELCKKCTARIIGNDND